MVRNGTTAALMLVALVGVAGCGGADVPDGQAGVGDTSAMAGHNMASGEGMAVDTVMMRRHAAELDTLVRGMRKHVAAMRRLPPGEWHARMPEHVPLVARMVALIDRQTSEMDGGMDMSQGTMGEMPGMGGEEFRAMRAEVEALRAEAAQLQTAQRADVTARMPAHIDRIEGLLTMMMTSAEHMQAGH